MVARVRTVAFLGIDALEVEAQVTVTSGVVAFLVVGLPDKAVGESRERVRAALAAMGLALPPKRIIVNLAPADLAKEGSHFDLPIALGLLAAMGVLPRRRDRSITSRSASSALDGAIAPSPACCPRRSARLAEGRGLICPAAQGGEAAWAGELEVLAAPSLLALINHFKGTQLLLAAGSRASPPERGSMLDLKDIKGQETAKRALEIAAAGGHNLLMVGPPGAGKSMLAARLPGILPPLDPGEALEVSMIHSVAGQLRDGELIAPRPFRDPHHSASLAALVGGGLRARPGEVGARASRRAVPRRAARIPARDARSAAPAAGDRPRCRRARQCACHLSGARPARRGDESVPLRPSRRSGARLRPGAEMRARTIRRRSPGRCFDRIDLHVDVPAVEARRPVAAAAGRRLGRGRGAGRGRPRPAAGALRPVARGPAHPHQCRGRRQLLEEVATPDADGRKLLAEAAERMRLSARGYHRVLRVARTLADLDASDTIRRLHIAEALSYRRVVLGAG